MNRAFLLRVSFIAGLGGILYGFDMGVIAGVMVFVQESFPLSTRMEEIVVSVVLVGAMLGAIVGGSIADRIGRRATLLWGGVIFLAGSLLAFWSPNVDNADRGSRVAGDCHRFHFSHCTRVYLGVGAAAIAGPVDRALPVRTHDRDRAGRSRWILAGRAACLAIDVRTGSRTRSVVARTRRHPS